MNHRRANVSQIMPAKIAAKDAAGIDGGATDEDLVASSIAVRQRKNARNVLEKNEDQTVRRTETGARPAAATGTAKIDAIIIVRRLWSARCRHLQ